MRLRPNYVATIRFLPPDEGGPERLPEDHLATDVRICGLEGWTLLMEFLTAPVHGRPVPAVVDFLSDDAPYECLVSGTPFELMRGASVVAEGVIAVDNLTVSADDELVDCDAGPVRTERPAA